MGVREWFSLHPRLTIGLVTTLIVASTAYVVTQFIGSRPKITDKLPDSFFTVDDGKTYFAANSVNVPPFDYKGQVAVHAWVFQCSSGKRFVGYLERFTPESHKAMLENRATPQDQISGRELKKPGETKWVRSNDHVALAKVTEVRCPDGHTGECEPVEP